MPKEPIFGSEEHMMQLMQRMEAEAKVNLEIIMWKEIFVGLITTGDCDLYEAKRKATDAAKVGAAHIHETIMQRAKETRGK